MKIRSTIRMAAAAALALGMTSVTPTVSNAQFFGEPADPWCFGVQNLSEFLASGGTCKSGYPHFSGGATEEDCVVLESFESFGDLGRVTLVGDDECEEDEHKCEIKGTSYDGPVNLGIVTLASHSCDP